MKSDILDEIKRLTERIEELGEERLQAAEHFHKSITDIINEFEKLPNKYENRKEMLKRVSKVAAKVQKIHYVSREGLHDIEAYDEILTLMRKRRLKAARKALVSLDELASIRGFRDKAVKEYEHYYRNIVQEKEGIEKDVNRLRSLPEHPGIEGNDADRLLNTIKKYNSQVQDVLDNLTSRPPSRDFVMIAADASQQPELGFPIPDGQESVKDLQEYLSENELGNESLHRLLGYARKSEDKLAHILDNPREFYNAVKPNLSWLESLLKIKRSKTLQIAEYDDPSSVSERISKLHPFISKVGKSVGIDVEPVIGHLQKIRDAASSGVMAGVQKYTDINKRYTHEDVEIIMCGGVEAELEKLEHRLKEVNKQLDELPEPGDLKKL